MAQLKDLLVQGPSRFIGPIYGKAASADTVPVVNLAPTLSYGSQVNIATIGGVNISANLPQGAAGAQGPEGPSATGAQGRQGRQGPKGSQGEAGTDGTNATGKQGPQGPTGAAGTNATGKQGPQGPTGAAGTNATGKQGPQGPKGTNGTNGANGTNGSQGPQGPKGAAGTNATGKQGPQGPKGAAGTNATGSQGPQGPKGANGTNGANGTGKQGPQGPKGAAGTNATGVQGPQGPKGTNASSISIAANTATHYLMGMKAAGTFNATNAHMAGTATGSGIYWNSSYNLFASSDDRLKNYLSDVNANLDDIAKIPKKYFKWKADGESGKTAIGTSAQELMKYYPELVDGGDGDKPYYAVAYDRLTIVALAAIDKLHEENSMLKSEIEELKKRVDKIEDWLMI